MGSAPVVDFVRTTWLLWARSSRRSLLLSVSIILQISILQNQLFFQHQKIRCAARRQERRKRGDALAHNGIVVECRVGVYGVSPL